MARGRFITFEGGDGAGKSTQIARLAARLNDRSIACQVTREPGGTPFAERVRGLILDGGVPEHGALSDAFLFAAARADHVETLIEPSLKAGTWVLSDRFSDSTRAYQGAAGGVDEATLFTIESITHPDTHPDLTIILDLDPVAGRRRIKERLIGDLANGSDDPFERRSEAFQVRLRDAFLAIAIAEPERCVVVDAAQSAESVELEIWSVMQARLPVRAQ